MTIIEDPRYPLNECVDVIERIIDDNIIRLYMSIDDFIFQDIHFHKIASNMPMWILNEGIGAEGLCTRDYYESLRRQSSHPIFGRFVYYYDLWSKIAALQDRLSAVKLFMIQFYEHIPCQTEYAFSQYTDICDGIGENETHMHIQLNSIFVALASAFDLLAKIATEQHSFEKYDFEKYWEMKSEKVLFNRSYQRNISDSLRTEGMLFSVPLVVKKIISFRDEYIHNGPWDLRCRVYSPWVGEEPVESFICAPDMDDHGNFVKSGSRNKFYSQKNRINFQLPDMIKEVLSVLSNTIDELSRLYQEETSIKEDMELTEECMNAIRDYYKSTVYTKKNGKFTSEYEI